MTERKATLIKKDRDEFDIKKVIGRLLDHWKLYALFIPLFILLGFLVYYYFPPFYLVHTKVLVQDESSDASGAASSFLPSTMLSGFSDLLDLPSSVNDELAILQSRDLLDKTVRDLDLNLTYYIKGIKNKKIYLNRPFTAKFIPLNDSTLLTRFNLDFRLLKKTGKFIISSQDISFKAFAQIGQPVLTPIGTFIITKTGKPFDNTAIYELSAVSVDATVDAISLNITSQIPDDKTDLITIDYKTTIPALGEDILKTLLREYLARNLSEKNKMSDSTLAFIDSRVLLVASDLQGIETNIAHFKQNNKLSDIDEQSKMLIDNTSDNYGKLNQADVQIDVVKTMLDYVKDRKNNDRPVPSLITTDPTFLLLADKYNGLLIEKDRLLLTVKETNPLTANLNTQIANLRNDMIKSLQSQLNTSQIARNGIQQQTNEIAGLIHNAPVQEKQYIDLSRERDVKQALYLFLLQKKEETAITKASNISSAAVIQTPKSEYFPYFPTIFELAIASLFLGFFIPTIIIIIRYTLGSRITSRDDITDNCDAPILAEIGHNDETGVLLSKNSRSSVSEQFRVFRTNMDFTTRNDVCPKILITSSMSGEGKSYIASNLAQVYAFSGKKVLLIEFDLRKPKLSSVLKVPNDTGFSNFMISGKDIFNFIKPIPENPSIHLLGSGPIPPNPAELLMAPVVKTMFETLEKEYDIIIMDTPPIGAVTDAQILNEYSTVNLFVVRQKYTYKNSLDIVNDLQETERFRGFYLVVNDVKKGTSYKYGYSYGYGYGYKYGN